ncbi:MAG: response regulator [Candidatus Eisenbacteria bacterium]|nr:response regulator [Candidatus Eisenbacteria bacterium]
MSRNYDRRMRLLLVDDSIPFLETAEAILSGEFDVACVSDFDRVLDACADEEPDAVLLDLYYDGAPRGFEILTELLAEYPFLPVIMWTESESMEDELRSQELGAFHHVRKDARPGEIQVVVDAALRQRRLLIGERTSRREADRRWGEFIYASETMERVFSTLERIAASDQSVLITGETGVGKGLLAREIHRRSSRAAGPFAVVECASLPDTIVENELFGHEKGAYTGAVSQQIGSCEAADGGTLFLDEIGDMPLVSQAKLLRLADEGRFKRLGGRHERFADIRIIAATNHDLASEAENGRFRKDLFYRLNTFHIDIPPLRERREDIVPLAQHFAAEFVQGSRRGFSLSPAAELYLQSQRWDGNVRELKHTIERACVLADDRHLNPRDLAVPAGPEVTLPVSYESERARVVLDLKKTLVRTSLARNGGNITRAAEDIGVTRQTFHEFLKETGIAAMRSEGAALDGS